MKIKKLISIVSTALLGLAIAPSASATAFNIPTLLNNTGSMMCLEKHASNWQNHNLLPRGQAWPATNTYYLSSVRYNGPFQQRSATLICEC